MNSRQRFLSTMRYEKPDRVPLFMEGIRDQVFEGWNQPGIKTKSDLEQRFKYDQREEIYLDLDPYPALKDWPTTTAQLERLKHHFDPDDPARWPSDWAAQVDAWRQRDHVLMLRVHRGLFLSMGIDGWARFSDVMELLIEAPEFVRAFMTFQGEFAAQMTARVLRDVSVDAVIFSEPISSNERPLISPKMYEDYVLKSYQPLLALLPDMGVETTILRTYANARILLSAAVEYGFNCLWACETDSTAMDYLDIRRQFGSDLRLIAGIDLDILLRDPQSMRAELLRVLPPLLSQGGFVPLLDGRVREYLPFESYQLYRELLTELC